MYHNICIITFLKLYGIHDDAKHIFAVMRKNKLLHTESFNTQWKEAVCVTLFQLYLRK